MSNRIYKFRAWHAEDKVMVYDLNSPQLFHGVLQADDYVLMQYTGLNDRNDKWIYEGDVVQREGLPGDKNLIEFYQGMFGWWDVIDGQKEFTVIAGWLDADLEIIGNSMENPELLENK